MCGAPVPVLHFVRPTMDHVVVNPVARKQRELVDLWQSWGIWQCISWLQVVVSSDDSEKVFPPLPFGLSLASQGWCPCCLGRSKKIEGERRNCTVSKFEDKQVTIWRRGSRRFQFTILIIKVRNAVTYGCWYSGKDFFKNNFYLKIY